MKRFTVADVMALGPCYEYDRVRVTALWAGREALTVREIDALDIPVADRHWAILRLITPSQALLDKWVERAIDRMNYPIVPKAWCEWAAKWKSGEERAASAAWPAEEATRQAWWARVEAAQSAGAAWPAEDARVLAAAGEVARVVSVGAAVSCDVKARAWAARTVATAAAAAWRAELAAQIEALLAEAQ